MGKQHGLKLVAAILGTCLVSAVASADIVTNLIAHYPFEGNASDVSGNGNNGSPNGTMALATDRFGHAGGAYEFNGTNSYITVPNSASLSSPTTALTQAAWFMLYGDSHVGSGFCPVTMKSATSENAFMYRFWVRNNSFGTAFNDWGTDRWTPRTFPLNEWHFAATVFDGASLKFYVDGVKVDSVGFVATMTADTRPLVIGADTPGILEVLNGRLDELWLYARALSAAEIAELYQASLAGVGDDGMLRSGLILESRPNPASGSATIDYVTSVPGNVDLGVFDLTGRCVRSLERGTLAAGRHATVWNGRDERGAKAPAGVYFLRLRSAGQAESRRILRVN